MAVVLLAPYGDGTPVGDRQPWLVAATPARRRDPQVIQLSLRQIASSPYAHMWNEARWLWDQRAQDTPEAVRWGVRDLDLDLLGLEDRAERIRALSHRYAEGGSPAGRAALCILLQDEGKIEEAFELFGIALSDEITRLLHGLPISGYLGTHLPAWSEFLRRQLRAAAPWLLPAVLLAEAERRSTLKSRPCRPPRFRLCALPHQTSVAKRSLMLAARQMDGTDPALEIEHTGWDYRLPEPSWKRPLEIDLRRFGLIAPP